MCYVRSIYSLFSSPDMYWNSCRCFVAIFQFFPIMFPVKCKVPPGELHLSFLWEYSLWFDVLLSPVCTASTLMGPPPPFGALNPTLTVRSVSCAQMRRVHLKTAGTTTRSAADGLAGPGTAVTQVFQKVPSTSSTLPSLSPALLDTLFLLRYCLPTQ